jgi:hypothetical protein
MPLLPAEYVQALADAVPKFDNPRLRMQSFQRLLMKYEGKPACLGLIRKLLDDRFLKFNYRRHSNWQEQASGQTLVNQGCFQFSFPHSRIRRGEHRTSIYAVIISNSNHRALRAA